MSVWSDPTRCTITDRGRDCTRAVPDDFHLSICLRHIREVGQYLQDILTAMGEQHPNAVAQIRGILGAAPDMAPFAEPLRVSVVYYIQFADRVKIGTSTDARRRLYGLPHDQVLAFELGGVTLERQRHQQFAQHRVTGEWFTAHPQILDHAAQLRRRQGSDPWSWLAAQRRQAKAETPDRNAQHVTHVPVPCPSCDLKAMVRWPGSGAECRSCHLQLTQPEIDALLAAAPPAKERATKPKISGAPPSPGTT